MTKIIVSVKGGPGSGFHGHAGRQGKRGGSSSGNRISKERIHIFDVSTDVMNHIITDDRSSKVAAALSADGSTEEVENVGLAISDVIPGFNTLISASLQGVRLPGTREERDIPQTVADIVHKFVDTIGALYEQAKSEEGWMSWQNIVSDSRDNWEKKWYGKVVGGSENGEIYGINYMHKLANSILGGRKISTPAIIKDYQSDYE